MTIYRVAWKRNDISLWQWKSTKLGTIHAVLGFLRMYHTIPVERLHVFSAFTLEDLDEQLMEENTREALLIAELVQQEQQTEENRVLTGALGTPEKAETIQEAFEVGQSRQGQEVLVPSSNASCNENALYAPSSKGGMSWMGQKRLEYEWGPGGDHDAPYSYTPPESFPLRLAWTRLLGKVQRGELEP